MDRRSQTGSQNTPRWLPLDEAVLHIGGQPPTWRKKLNQEEDIGYPARKQPWGSRYRWEICIDGVHAGDYSSLVALWLDDLKNGFTTGNPAAPATVYNQRNGMLAFGHHLRGEAVAVGDTKQIKYTVTPPIRLDEVTPDNLMRCLANIPQQKHACRQQTLKAFRSFYAFLVRRGLRDAASLTQLQGIRLKRTTEVRRLSVTDEQFDHLVAVNEATRNGRTEYDVALMRALLFAYRYSGARRNEILFLKKADTDFKNKTLYFPPELTKTRTGRTIGMRPILVDELAAYLAVRPKAQKGVAEFFLWPSGIPVAPRAVNRRFTALGKAAKVSVHPHALRRSHETELLLKGVPPSQVGRIHGQKQLSTVSIYDMSRDVDALDLMRRGF